MSSSILEPLFDLEDLSTKNGDQHSFKNGLTGQDILSVSQFDRMVLDYIFTRAREMREMVSQVSGVDLLKGRVLACLFYEPSTRTSASFIAAMERLGGSVIPITQGVHDRPASS
jgi:carbamoyl-phosphate synthase/aspartate carbamoyltransferase/dihydroorotase/carbamoyl-phosphate synthase/aspartate carbamoyltransferase